jgi:hypothetical protein
MDSETREALILVCDALRAQFDYLSSAQRLIVSLGEAIAQELPVVEAKRRALVILSEDRPERQQLLAQLDALLEQLRNQ